MGRIPCNVQIYMLEFVERDENVVVGYGRRWRDRQRSSVRTDMRRRIRFPYDGYASMSNGPKQTGLCRRDSQTFRDRFDDGMTKTRALSERGVALNDDFMFSTVRF